MRAVIQSIGLADIVDEIGQVMERVRNPRPLAKIIARRLRACFAENFNAEGRPEKWTALAPSTVADKQRLYDAGLIRGRRRGIRARLGPGGQQRGDVPGILIRSGELKDSVARAHTRGNIERILDNGKEIVVGSSLEYARVHDQGGQGEYTIAPRRGKVLAWFGIDRKTGQPGMIFARGPVRHPPLPRRSFLVVTDDTWELIGKDVLEYITPGVPSGSTASD